MPTNTRTFSPPKLHLMYIYEGIFTFHKCRFSLFLRAQSEHTAAHKLTQLFFKLFFQFLALLLLRLLWICLHLREFIHVLVLSLYKTMCISRAPLVKITNRQKLVKWNRKCSPDKISFISPIVVVVVVIACVSVFNWQFSFFLIYVSQRAIQYRREDEIWQLSKMNE